MKVLGIYIVNIEIKFKNRILYLLKIIVALISNQQTHPKTQTMIDIQ